FNGVMLLGLILVSLPSSSYQVILLSSKSVTLMTFVNCLNAIIYELTNDFIFHLVAAFYTYRIHGCAKTLLSRCASFYRNNAKPPHFSYLRYRLQMALYTEKFHTKKRYGLNYTSYGLISMGSFFKVTRS